MTSEIGSSVPAYGFRSPFCLVVREGIAKVIEPTTLPVNMKQLQLATLQIEMMKSRWVGRDSPEMSVLKVDLGVRASSPAKLLTLSIR